MATCEFCGVELEDVTAEQHNATRHGVQPQPAPEPKETPDEQ